MDTKEDTIPELTTEEILAAIRRDKARLEGKFDDQYTYRQIVEDDIVELMGFTTFSEDRKQKFRDTVAEMLENRVAMKILDGLDDDDRATYVDMIESGEHQLAYNFVLDKGIDPLEIITIESIMLKVELYLDSKAIKSVAQEKFDQKHSNKGEK